MTSSSLAEPEPLQYYRILPHSSTHTIKWFFEILRGETIRLLQLFHLRSRPYASFTELPEASMCTNFGGIRRSDFGEQKPCRCCRCCVRLLFCTGRFVSWGFTRIGKQLHLLSHVSRQRERGPIPIYVEVTKRHPIISHLQLQHFPTSGTFHPRWIHIYQYPIALIRKLLTPEWRCFFKKIFWVIAGVRALRPAVSRLWHSNILRYCLSIINFATSWSERFEALQNLGQSSGRWKACKKLQ